MDDASAKSPPSGLPVLPTQRAYVCPGEHHPIPRSIHLARLAAYYPKCRECEHRHDTGQLPRSTVGRLEQTAARVVRPSPFRDEGVRGEYLNHLTRQIAGRVAAAVADRLWETHPLIGRVPDNDESPDEPPPPRHHSCPVVVMGHDARASSPDLSVGISTSLRRMGCEVVDVGRVTPACHAFAVEHLQADGGLFVTGSGHPSQWSGVDFAGPRGLPWSLGAGAMAALPSAIPNDLPSVETGGRSPAPGTLVEIERRFLAGVSRPTRQGGQQRYFEAAVPYQANLIKHFRDLRPLRVVFATADRVLMQTLQSAFASLPCDLLPIAEPAATIDPTQSDDRLTKQMRTAVKDADAAFAIAVAEDGQGICLFDEKGRPVDAIQILLSAIVHTRGNRSSLICVPTSTGEVVEAATRNRVEVCAASGTRESLVTRLYEPEIAFGLEPGGRLWLKDTVPTCDAILTIGLLLRILSRQKEPFSTTFDSIR